MRPTLTFDLLARLVGGVCWSLGSTARDRLSDATIPIFNVPSFLIFFGDVVVRLRLVAFLNSF